MKKGIIILLCFVSAQTFGEWKFYSSEGKKKKKEVNNKEIDKEDFLYDTHLFNALKAKSLENYEEALRH
jgi:hypothetical protein